LNSVFEAGSPHSLDGRIDREATMSENLGLDSILQVGFIILTSIPPFRVATYLFGLSPSLPALPLFQIFLRNQLFPTEFIILGLCHPNDSSSLSYCCASEMKPSDIL